MNCRSLWFCSVAIGIAMLSGVALGQQRVGNDGHAMDANTQVGSGGYNQNTNITQQALGNDIASGNVTGGFQFRGTLPFTDLSSFHGTLPGEGVDSFVAGSTGVPTMAQPTLRSAAQGPQVFYPVSVTAGTPAGFTTTPSSGGNYLPSAPPTINPADTRLGAPDDVTNVPIQGTDDLTLPGQVDTSAGGTSNYYTASPLYGVRMWQSGTQPMTTPGAAGNPTGYGAGNPTMPNVGSPLDPNRVSQIRSEFTQGSQPTGSGPVNPGNTTGAQNPNSPLTPLTAGGTTNNPNQPLQPLQVQNNPLLATPLSPTAGDMSKLPPPDQQSTQLAEIHRRFSAYNKAHPPTQDQANKDQTTGQQNQQNPQNPATPTNNTDLSAGLDNNNQTTTNPPVTGTPDQSTVTAVPAAPGPAPVQVGSIAEGMQSKSMTDMLKQAEGFMQQQQYGHAIEIYNQAIAIVPNNPLIAIGRAHAELGGSYYQQAEADLRTAFKGDPSVMIAQYDLNSVLGEQRLKFIVTDLKQIASDSPHNPTPVFLLAYIAYNTHHEDMASGWLDVANKRAGGTDDVIPMLKKYWTFTPSTQPSP